MAKRLEEKGKKIGFEQGMEQGMEQGIEQGIEQGVEKGMEQGVEKGMEQGVEKGVEKGAREIAVRLLKEGGDVLFVSKITQLTQKEVESLQAGIIRGG